MRVGTRPRQKDIVGLANGMAGRAGGWGNPFGELKTVLFKN